MTNRYKCFQGLAVSRFGENEQEAKQWVADLGRAAYFWQMKPQLSIEAVKKYREIFPEFFIWRKGQIVGLNWKNEEFRNRGGRGMKT